MSKNEINKKCPEYCPFLKANNTFCELFKKSLQVFSGITYKCENCLNPEQRMTTYKSLGLSLDSRISMWQKAIFKYNEIELGKKREEEIVRKKFASFLEDKYGAKPPLAGNVFLNNLVINLFMVLDATERSMMQSVLNGNGGIEFLLSIERAPRDESLLRNIRRELDSAYRQNQQNIQNNIDSRIKTK
ncbi:hypothetical protein IKB17_00595 [bacterium]|nr:hypothetical protein [bacterium]